jgi:hypothetical protein
MYIQKLRIEVTPPQNTDTLPCLELSVFAENSRYFTRVNLESNPEDPAAMLDRMLAVAGKQLKEEMRIEEGS